MYKRFKSTISNNRHFLVFILLMVLFRGAIADWSDVPTGSMQPTIQIGDRILIDKTAYDIRIPLTHISLYQLGNPQRGDVIIFDSAVSEKRLVKRVIGVPGDTIDMRNNELTVNGAKLDYQVADDLNRYTVKYEELDGEKHTIKIQRIAGRFANFGPIEVPADHYLVLGDNRDSSADSRVIGFVPRKEIIGKSSRVAFSLDYDNYFLPRAERFWASFNWVSQAKKVIRFCPIVLDLEK